jgi:hypothetical protein
MTDGEIYAILETMHRMLSDIGTGDERLDKEFDDCLRDLDREFPHRPRVEHLRQQFDLVLNTKNSEQDRNRFSLGGEIFELKTSPAKLTQIG